MIIDKNTHNPTTDRHDAEAIKKNATPVEIMPKGKLLGILTSDLESTIEPISTFHQFVKNSIDLYPKVGDLIPHLA